ncbi:MAG: carbohydrate ABC transporter permease [Spirochaetales bacterium]|nr:carbohydrate ABC transporter permease [Spirochaetales bacterium]
MNREKKLNLTAYILLIFGSIMMLFPFLWMLFTSFKTVPETTMIPPTLLPNDFSNMAAYNQATASLPFLSLYFNTISMIFWRIVTALLFSSMAGYAFAKINFPFKKILFALVVSQLMFPAQIYILPQYEMIARLGMADTIFALVFPGLVSAFGTFFLRQAYMGIPDDLIAATKIDGCNHFRAFLSVAAPLTKTPMAALSVFTALFAYGDLMWPLIVNTKTNMLTLSSGLSTLRGQFSVNYPNLMAGSVLAMIPMIIIYLIFQRQFIEGIALTGTKS